MGTRDELGRWSGWGLTGLGILVGLTSVAAFWGIAEFFHEGWFVPYGKYLPFYLLPMAVFMALTLLAARSPGRAGSVVVAGALVFTLWRHWRLRLLHAPVPPSLWIMGLVLSLPGLVLLVESWRRRRAGEGRVPAPLLPRRLAVGLPLAILVAVGAPSLHRVLGRTPLRGYGPVTVRGNGVTLTFARAGPGWLNSNTHPVVFQGRAYAGLSWNEIALFGAEPMGFEGKRWGVERAGGSGEFRDATVEEFRRYNMFRYIDPTGSRLTRTIHDAWRLPTAGELVAVLTRRGRNAGGTFDPITGRARFTATPDKEAPLWDPGMEVIYYWTATGIDRHHALDVSYSGRVRPVLKSSALDNRGFRAVLVAGPGLADRLAPPAGSPVPAR